MAIGFVASAHSQSLAGHWILRIKKMDQSEATALKIRFTDDAARSCMAGEWKRVVVDDMEATDRNFFPAADPLSYRIEGSELTIGRNEICDAYLHLRGKLANESAEGSYSGFGINRGRPLGTFTLTKDQ